MRCASARTFFSASREPTVAARVGARRRDVARTARPRGRGFRFSDGVHHPEPRPGKHVSRSRASNASFRRLFRRARAEPQPFARRPRARRAWNTARPPAARASRRADRAPSRREAPRPAHANEPATDAALGLRSRARRPPDDSLPASPSVHTRVFSPRLRHTTSSRSPRPSTAPRWTAPAACANSTSTTSPRP